MNPIGVVCTALAGYLRLPAGRHVEPVSELDAAWDRPLWPDGMLTAWATELAELHADQQKDAGTEAGDA